VGPIGFFAHATAPATLALQPAGPPPREHHSTTHPDLTPTHPQTQRDAMARAATLLALVALSAALGIASAAGDPAPRATRAAAP
jgi:hypothetical protein